MPVKCFMNKITFYFNVLDSLLKDWISSKLNSTSVISMKTSSSKFEEYTVHLTDLEAKQSQSKQMTSHDIQT